jgi:predicted MFS family arabinose efflux permease
VQRMAPAQQGAVLGWDDALQSVGRTLAPLVAGYLLDRAGAGAVYGGAALLFGLTALLNVQTKYKPKTE